MKTSKALLLSIPVTSLLLLNSCTTGTLLSTHTVRGPEPGSGTFNLILYGGQNARDFRTVAILDRSDDRYTILPYGAAYNYRIIKDLPAAEAMEKADRFINDIISYRASGKREIYGPDNTVIGYELRPLYMPLATGRLGDLLETSYHLSGDNQVTVYVSFKGEYQDDREGSPSGFRPGAD